MRISELKKAIREMIVGELNETVFAGTGAIDDLQKNTAFNSLNPQGKMGAMNALKGGGSVNLQEDEALNEMAKIAGDLKAAIEKVIEKNKDAEKKVVRKAIKTDDEVQAALGPDDDLFDNQLNKFIDLIRGEREVGQRGRKADPNKPAAEPKEPGMRGRPKSANPAAKKKDGSIKTRRV